MNEQDVLAIAENFTKSIKNKKIADISSFSNKYNAYAVLQIKVTFKGRSNGE